MSGPSVCACVLGHCRWATSAVRSGVRAYSHACVEGNEPTRHDFLPGLYGVSTSTRASPGPIAAGTRAIYLGSISVVPRPSHAPSPCPGSTATLNHLEPQSQPQSQSQSICFACCRWHWRPLLLISFPSHRQQQQWRWRWHWQHRRYGYGYGGQCPTGGSPPRPPPKP